MERSDGEVMAVCLVLVFLAIWVGAIVGINLIPEALPS